MYQGIEIIAEVKTESPFGWKSAHSWDDLFQIANRIGDILSIHTDPRWGGSFDLIRKARMLTKKPILAKGIHEFDDDIEEAIRAGADHVLVVGRLPDVHQEKCWIEPLSVEELQKIPENYRVVWNSRNLKDGTRKKETFSEIRALRSGWLCQASFIRSVEDIHPNADAVLVGTHLVEFAEYFEK